MQLGLTGFLLKYDVLFLLSKSAVGSGQAGLDERAPEGSEVSVGRGILEAADFLCQWYLLHCRKDASSPEPHF